MMKKTKSPLELEKQQKIGREQHLDLTHLSPPPCIIDVDVHWASKLIYTFGQTRWSHNRHATIRGSRK